GVVMSVKQGQGAAPPWPCFPMSPPHPDWLAHELTVSGSDVPVFRQAAARAGGGPWLLDYDRLEEGRFPRLLVPPRAISVGGARVLARRLREAVWARHEAALAQVGTSGACVFDLHVLVPVPRAVLALGPDDARARAWMWEHWGTTWGLRRV